MIAPAIAPPITFFLSAFGSAFADLRLLSAAIGVTVASTWYVLSFTTIERDTEGE